MPADRDGPPTERLAEFVAAVDYGEIPGDAVRLAERAFLDTVGVTLAGGSTAAYRTACSALEGRGTTPTPLVDGPGSSLASDAFLHGTASHALDFDDVSLQGMDGHPSAPMVAPLLGVGADVGASGREVLRAYVAGFEAQCFLAGPISPGHYERGWHATATFGTFGAAAAVANLLGLSPGETRHALGIAASMPAGLKRNFGSMTKPMHVGQAARSGTTAALLAAEGFTADPGAVGGDGGFIDLYAGADGPDRDAFPALGDRWALSSDGIDVKKYPCCYYTHAAIEATLTLASAHDIEPDDVTEVSVTASRGAADALAHENPRTGLEGKFSMAYVVAAAIADRAVTLATFEDDHVADGDVQRVRERVAFAVDDTLPYGSNAATVAVRTTDGTVERSRDRPPGTHEAPLSRDELAEKFRMCAGRVLSETRTRRLEDALDDLRDADDVGRIFESA